MAPLRWLFTNIGTLLLALILAVVVWISAVTASNPNVERTRTVPLDIIGLDADMLIVGNVPTQVRVTLEAPSSVMDSMNAAENAVQAWVDLAGLDPGTHDLRVQVQVNPAFRPVRQGPVIPELVEVTLEPLLTRSFPVKIDVTGEPAVGYQKGRLVTEPSSVTVSGAASLVSQIEQVGAALDISGVTETIERNVSLVAVDQQGEAVSPVAPFVQLLQRPVDDHRLFNGVNGAVAKDGVPRLAGGGRQARHTNAKGNGTTGDRLDVLESGARFGRM